AAAANRRHRPLVRTEGRIPVRRRSRAGLSAAWRARCWHGSDAARRTAYPEHARLLHARGRARDDTVRLGAVSEVHAVAPRTRAQALNTCSGVSAEEVETEWSRSERINWTSHGLPTFESVSGIHLGGANRDYAS